MELFDRVRRRIAPLHGVMKFREYRRVNKIPPLTTATAKVFGQPVEFSDTVGFKHSLIEIFTDQVYKFHTNTKTPLIVDVGANIGLSVIYFKRLFPNCEIIAFEPDPKLFDILSKNVKVWKLKDVDLRNSAAWTSDGELTFYREGSLAGSSELDFLSRGEMVVVKSERLKDLLAGREVDFLKIDIEGAENFVLPDIEPVLSRVKAMFFEYHSVPGKPQTLAELLAIAARQGFRYVINGSHGARYPFIERTTSGFDLQLNVSCFRPTKRDAPAAGRDDPCSGAPNAAWRPG